MGKSAPAAPDPVATANAQGAANADAARVTARINRADTFGPGGSVVNREVGPDKWEQTTTLSQGQQGIYNNQQDLGNITSKSASDAAWRMSQQLGTSVNTADLPKWGGQVDASNLPFRDSLGSNAKFMSYGAGAGAGIKENADAGGPMGRVGGAGQFTRYTIEGDGGGGATAGVRQGFEGGTAPGQVTGAGQGVQAGLGGAGAGIRTDFNGGAALARQGTQDYGQQSDEVRQALLSRTEPMAQRDRAAMEARLASQGFVPGSQGYKDGADELNRSRNDARMQAVLAGGQEQSRLFGLDQSRLGFNNSASMSEAANHNTAVLATNAAQAQGFGQGAQAGAFANEAQAQGFGQAASQVGANNASGAAFTAARNAALQGDNAAAGQTYQQRMGANEFANQAQAQGFGQGTAQTGFNNQASEAETAARNAALQIGNQAQQQGYQQRAGDAGIANSALDSAFQQDQANASFTNMSRTQALNEGYAASDFQTKQRQQLLAEQLQLRAQPINEVSALFGLGSGVNMPQQAQVAPVNVAAPDYQGLVQNQYNTKSQAAAAGNSATASGVAAVASAAAIAI